MKRHQLFILAILGLLFLSSCTANPHIVEECVSGDRAGFLMGLWHGCIAPITFLISIFTDNLTVYEINNNGNWYNFGFLLGVGAFTGGGLFGGRKVSKRD